MVRALLFDMGGTLDGDGLHWLDRFASLYESAGVVASREAVRAAFDEAERRAAADGAISCAGLDEMVARHVGWQLAHLGMASAPLGAALAADFVGRVRRAARANSAVLEELKARGLVLGVVSNGCGNVDVLCDDFGYAPLLSVIVDSRRVGLYKPDPAIYVYAAARLACPPSSIMMVGDSFDRDVLPARSIGMKTAWLQGPSGRPCPDRSVPDVCLRALTDLPAALEARERTVA